MKQLRSLGEGFSIKEVLEDIDWTDSYGGWTEELRYLLFRYDEYLAREEGEKINETQWNKIWQSDPSKSVEHIQPQSSNFTYVHHLGNLAMLPPGVNSSLKDKSPKAKAEAYKRSGLLATMQVGRDLERLPWNKDAVLARAADIERFAKKEWGK